MCDRDDRIRNLIRAGFGTITIPYIKIVCLMLAIILTVTFISCSGSRLVIPAITDFPTENYNTGKFVWHDLITDQVPAVKEFYSQLFGWEYEGRNKEDAPFTLIKFKGRTIGGIVYSQRLNQKVSEARWLSYVSVPDVDRATQFVSSMGGVIHRKPDDFPDRGRLSIVSDPQGAVIGFLKASGGDPEDRNPEIGEWLWNELLTSDDVAAANFYQRLVGYEHEVQKTQSQRDYYVMNFNGKPRAGIIKSPWEDVKPNWLCYILVEDPAPLASKAKSLGGEILLAPDEKIRKGSVAVIADPSGAALAIQKWPY